MRSDGRDSVTLPRRALLAALGGAVPAGCLGGGGGNDGTGFENHPATVDLASAPRLGPPPGSAETTVVAFGDPSCPQCSAFAEHTLPELRAEYIGAGRMSYVWRALPSVEAWAESAVVTMLAAHDQEPDTFWWVQDRYHEHQSRITTENVVDEAVGWLAGRDNVDADEVRRDVAAGRFDPRVTADQQAADDSGVDVVPSFVLFNEGEFVSIVVGPHSSDLFAAALDL